MPDLKFEPVKHDHKAFLDKASKQKGFKEAYETLEPKYQLAAQLLRARSRAGLTQEGVAERMGTTKSVISRIEAAGKHTPSLTTLQRYAKAVGCEVQVKLVPQR